jgi:hypothetical protein
MLLVILVVSGIFIPVAESSANKEVEASGWMGALRPETPLKEIPLLGSLDASAFDKPEGHFFSQKSIIKYQLLKGMRALELKVRYLEPRVFSTGGTWKTADLKLLRDMLLEVKDFLSTNTMEFVVIYLKPEVGFTWNEDKVKSIGKVFSEVFDEQMRAPSNLDENTSLKELWGKILVVGDGNAVSPLFIKESLLPRCAPTPSPDQKCVEMMPMGDEKTVAQRLNHMLDKFSIQIFVPPPPDKSGFFKDMARDVATSVATRLIVSQVMGAARFLSPEIHGGGGGSDRLGEEEEEEEEEEDE